MKVTFGNLNHYFQVILWQICQENVPTDGPHYWKSNLHILQSGFVRICLKYFFLVRGDFGSFCFSFSGILCEQSITLPGMFYQQYSLRQPKRYTNTMDIPVLDCFAPSWFRAGLVLPWAFQHHSISTILSTGAVYFWAVQITGPI